MDIEVLATSAVKEAIAKTDYLSPYVQEKDREPMWDGHIYAYRDKKTTNTLHAGRAPVQVKGKVVKRTDKAKCSYRISINNLKQYCLDGGVIYFVVFEQFMSYPIYTLWTSFSEK